MEVRILTVKEVLSATATGIHKHGVWAAKVEEGEPAARRRRALRRLDRELEKGNCKAAMSLMKQFKAHPAGFLRGFGSAAAATKVPRAASSVELAGRSEISSLQLVVDAILHSIKRSLEFQTQEEETEVLCNLLFLYRISFFLVALNQSYEDCLEKSLRASKLLLHRSGNNIPTMILPQDFGKTTDADRCNSIFEDRVMCMQHEAGHFLVGYMLGVLPRRYIVPSVEDLLQDKFARGKVDFVGFEFLRELGVDHLSDRNFSKGKLNKETLTKFSCVTLGGLAAEHLLFGYSEFLHSDVQKLDRVLKWLDLTENEVDFEHRQAAEATVLILSSHSEALSRLAEAMALGRSVGFCIETIEHALTLSNKL